MTTSLIVEQLTVFRVFCLVATARIAWYLAGQLLELLERAVERYLFRSSL